MRDSAIGLVWTGAGWHAMTAAEAETAFGTQPGWLDLEHVVASRQLAFLLIAPCAGARDTDGGENPRHPTAPTADWAYHRGYANGYHRGRESVLREQATRNVGETEGGTGLVQRSVQDKSGQNADTNGGKSRHGAGDGRKQDEWGMGGQEAGEAEEVRRGQAEEYRQWVEGR
jgi:hypothetical protein